MRSQENQILSVFDCCPLDPVATAPGSVLCVALKVVVPNTELERSHLRAWLAQRPDGKVAKHAGDSPTMKENRTT